jgi:hypothetical protein
MTTLSTATEDTFIDADVDEDDTLQDDHLTDAEGATESEYGIPAKVGRSANRISKTNSLRSSSNFELNPSWMSLLELLEWYEYFVTTEQTMIWRKHIAWAKTSGGEIRNYTTQRFSSHMIILSLLLSAEMNVLFNSSSVCAEIRASLRQNNVLDMKFYIGFLLAMGACITLLGLVTTFTAWGLISAISDENAHALLRSSTGQYVTALPSQFVVASMYFFLSWLLLFIVDLTTAGSISLVSILIVSIVLALFFQVVVSLSAFGRLIIHTGAMGSKCVLDPALEHLLLPSGLHAALLIIACNHHQQSCSDPSRSLFARDRHDDGSRAASSKDTSFQEDNAANFKRHGHSIGTGGGSDDGNQTRRAVTERGIEFPRASILNRAQGTSELRTVVQETLREETRPPPPPPHETRSSRPPVQHPPRKILLMQAAQRLQGSASAKLNKRKAYQEYSEEQSVRNLYCSKPSRMVHLGETAIEEDSGSKDDDEGDISNSQEGSSDTLRTAVGAKNTRLFLPRRRKHSSSPHERIPTRNRNVLSSFGRLASAAVNTVVKSSPPGTPTVVSTERTFLLPRQGSSQDYDSSEADHNPGSGLTNPLSPNGGVDLQTGDYGGHV